MGTELVAGAGTGVGAGFGGGPPASNLTAPMPVTTNNTNKHNFFISASFPSIFCFDALSACPMIVSKL